MSDPTFIPDGYELDGFIAASKGQHGAVKFKYRPLTVDERDEIRTKLSTKAVQLNSELRTIFADKIRSWDVQAPGAAAAEFVPITADNLLRLHPRIFDKLYWVICEEQRDGLPFNHPNKAAGDSSEAAALKN
jgi:hypothetical protein